MTPINEKVLVGFSDKPKWINWRNKIYKITKIGLHHKYKKGVVLHHIFSVLSDTLFMRLNFNSQSLTWKLEEIENGI